MTVHPVRLPVSGPNPRWTATMASLPDTFRPSSDAVVSAVSVVDGTPGWAARATEEITRGVRAVIVDRPGPEPVDDAIRLQALARERGIVVAVDTPYAGSPTWASCRDGVLKDVADSGLLDCLAVVGGTADLDRALLAQVALVRPLLGRTTLRRLGLGARNLVTRAGSLAVSVTVAVSARPGLTLDLVGSPVRWRVELPDDGTARSGSATRYDAEGSRGQRPVHSTSSRATWLALAVRLDGGADVPLYDLDDLVLDLRLLAGT